MAALLGRLAIAIRRESARPAFDRKADAQAFLSRVAVDLHRGEWRDPALGRILLHEWVGS
jgi:hypothetical protein